MKHRKKRRKLKIILLFQYQFLLHRHCEVPTHTKYKQKKIINSPTNNATHFEIFDCFQQGGRQGNF